MLDGKRYWVNFEGADNPSEGKYATCLPFEYAMEPTNDVILAYEMNDVPLPPDHGYPVRLMIPGYVGGRCVKWLKRIWISDKENDSHYHIWDNRVLPTFVTEKDGEFAETLFRHPDTAWNEQNLNSVIVKPAQGEKIPLTSARKDMHMMVVVTRSSVLKSPLMTVRRGSIAFASSQTHPYDTATSSGRGYIGTLTSRSPTSCKREASQYAVLMYSRIDSQRSQTGTLWA
jgi:hypothetical protein